MRKTLTNLAALAFANRQPQQNQPVVLFGTADLRHLAAAPMQPNLLAAWLRNPVYPEWYRPMARSQQGTACRGSVRNPVSRTDGRR